MAPRKLAAGNWKMNGDLAALAEIDALTAAHAAPGEGEPQGHTGRAC